MKKFISIASLFVFVAGFIFSGCAVKGVTPETQKELDEAKTACEAAEDEATSLENELKNLEAEKADKEAKLEELKTGG